MTKISDIAGNAWEMQLKVNRALWRNFSFKEQQEISHCISQLQCRLEEQMEKTIEKLSAKNAETETGTETETETRPLKK